MATMREEYTTQEQRFVVCFFLWAKGRSAKDICKEMFAVYDVKSSSRKAVHNWVR
jgi:hypothetical protein